MDKQTDNDGFNTTQLNLVRALSAFEHSQQHIDFRNVGAAQRTLVESIGSALDDATRWSVENLLSQNNHAALAAIDQALNHLNRALASFRGGGNWPEFGAAFFASRGDQCAALEILYRARSALPLIEPYFRDPAISLTQLPADNPHAKITTGITHHSATAQHNNYSLYVPEYYDDSKQWPLIVSLHGGYGRGDEYLWTWLRPARSHGYAVLSPKSIGPTWSILQPNLDSQSILNMLDEVFDTVSIDRARIYLTGLSDGGTFSYLLGLQHHQRFAALAPIAGVLSPMVDVMLRAGLGRELPIQVTHGAQDMIFPVQSVRSTNELLRSLGYNLTYHELPDWGHALTHSINEQLVLPWFAEGSAASH